MDDQPRDQKPWERVGLSRATYYRHGKPPEVVQKAGAQMLYTADGGMQRLPEIAREIQKKPDLAQFRVVRRKSKKSKPSRSKGGAELSDTEHQYLRYVYQEVAEYGQSSGQDLVWLWWIDVIAKVRGGQVSILTAARASAAELDIDCDPIDNDFTGVDTRNDYPEPEEEFSGDFDDIIETAYLPDK